MEFTRAIQVLENERIRYEQMEQEIKDFGHFDDFEDNEPPPEFYDEQWEVNLEMYYAINILKVMEKYFKEKNINPYDLRKGMVQFLK